MAPLNTTAVGSPTATEAEYADYRSNAMGTAKNDFRGAKDVELHLNDVAQNYLDGLLLYEA